ncbi:MAG: DUF2303 family protein, partial [Pseudomonadales bacterium]
MSLTEQAITKIVGLSNTGTASETLMAVTEGRAVVLHKENGVTDIENLLPLRSRFRGMMQTTSINANKAYVESRQEECSCFIDQDNMSASTIFNLWDSGTGLPGHCDDKAALTLQKTAAYKSLLNINEQTLSQKALAEWMEDWANN